MRSQVAIAVALVALLSPQTFSAPATRSSCTPVCRKSQDSKVNYQDGKSYTYGFETEVITQVLGSTEEQSKIKVKGQAVIAAQSACDFILTIQQAAIQTPNGQSISKVDDLEGSSLRFAYQNGKIESVCVSEDDVTWSANVKRAVISMLTHSETDGETIETDVSGKCPTKYSVSGNTYTKARDLNQCSHRDGGSTVFMGVPYEVESKFNSMSVIDSILSCTQELKDGVFQQISCVEKHQVPFLSTKNSGVHTEVKSSLTLVSTQDGLQKGSKAVTQPSSIFYDHSQTEEFQRKKSSASRAVDILNKICQEVEDGTVTSKVPSLYLQLIKALKTSRKDDVKQMYARISTGGLCSKATEKVQKLFVDAVASSGSDGPIAFMAELLANDQAECYTKALFHNHATFAPRPGTEALEALETLISKSDVESEHLLTASAVAHQYCKMTNNNCGSNNEYHSLVDKIAQHVRPASDDEGIRKVVAALQALGNLDHLTPAAVSAVSRYIDDQSAGERLRIRALDASRRDPCQAELKQKALKIFADKQESSHVRIQAYLSAVKCFKPDDITTLQSALNAEESTQVGSFVASHIENVVESASPTKKDVKNLFGQLTIPEGLRRDVRKFSRNSEYSTFFPQLNLGGLMEGNLIFSQDSFIPRMASANMTLDAFGRSYNFLEVGLYAEDFEHLVEKYLGPSGKIRQTNLEQFIQEGSKKVSQLVEGIRNRFKRDVKVDIKQNEIDNIKEKVHIDERIGDHGVGDIYIRIMGTSILAESFNMANAKEGSLSKKLRRGVEQLVEGAKEHKFDITHPVVFIDEELVLPTFSGLPLTVEIEGSSVLSMQMNGNLDVASFFRSETSDLRAKMIPSAATLLKTRMTIGAGPVESGLQLEAKVHSSAGVDVKMVKEDSKFEFRFNLPQERTQVIDMRSDLYWVEQGQDSFEKKTLIQGKVPTRSLIENDCSNLLSKTLGLKVCADVKVPTISASAPFAVLNGPAVLSLSIEKSEPTMEGYHLKIEKNTQDEENCGVSFLLDTPGSRTNRKISANFNALKYKSNTPEYIFKLESPWTELGVEYKRAFTDDLKGVEIKVVSDGSPFTGKMQLRRVKSGSVNKYEPVMQYSIPGGRPVKLVEGHIIILEGQGKIDLDLKTAGPMRALRASVKGSLESRRKSDGFELKAKNLELSSELVGKVILDGHFMKEKMILDTKVHAKYGQNSKHKLEYESKVGMPKHGHYELKVKTRSSRLSFLNFDLDGEVVKEGHSYKSELKYSRGLEEPKVHFFHKVKTTIKSPKEFDFVHEVELKYPVLDVDMFTKLEASFVPDDSRKAEIHFNFNSFKSNAKYEGVGQNLLDYDIKAKADYAGKTYEMSEVGKKVNDFKQNFKSRIAVTPGNWFEAETEVVCKYEKLDIENTLQSTITSDTFTNPIVFKSGVRVKAEGYNALMKLDMKGKNYVDFTTYFKHAKSSKPATLNMKGTVLNYVDTKLSQTFSGPKSEMQMEFKWLPTGRKIEATSSLALQGEVFQADADLKWDSERDASQAITLKSVTNFSLSKLQFDSKNDITLKGKLAKINVKGKGMKELFNGQDSFELEYVSPNGKAYSVATVLDMENKLRIKSAKFNAKLTLPNEKPYDFTWDNRVTNLDSHEQTFEAVSEMKFDYKGETDVVLRGELGSTLPGNYRSYAGKVALSGSLMKQPVSTNLKVDIKKGKLNLKGAANRGERNGDFDVEIDYDIWAPKKKLNIHYTINAPFEHFKTVEVTHKYGFLYNSWKNFEFDDEGSFAVNHGSPVQWKHLTSALDTEFKYLSEYNNDGKNVYQISADAKVTRTNLRTNLEAIYKEEKSFLAFDADYEMPSLGFDLKGGVSDKTFEVKSTHKKLGAGIYETDLLAKTAGEIAFRVTNKMEMSDTKRSVDIMLAAAEEPTRRAFVSIDKSTPNKYNLDVMLRWGDGNKFMSSKGDIVRSSNGFDANLSFDCPELKAKDMVLKVSKNYEGNRHKLSAKVLSGANEKFSALANYGVDEKSGAQKIYEGSVAINQENAIDISGKFRLEDSILSRQRGDNEDGREFRGSFDVRKSNNPVKGTAVLKTSDKEKRIQLSVCNEGKGRCRSGDAHFRHQHESNGDLEYTLKIVGETQAGGKQTATGVVIRTSKADNGRQMDHTVKLILNKENSEQVGYRIYRKDGHEIGGEILLPERIIATVLDCEMTGTFDGKVDLSFYIDRSRRPERKISMIFNTEQHKGRTGWGRDFGFTLRHPDIPKDLKVHTQLSYEPNSFEVKTVLDIFKENSEITVAYKAKREASSVKTQWSVLSKGQDINMGGKSEMKAERDMLSYTQEIHYENREKQMKTAKIETLLSANKMSFEVKGQSEKFISLIATFEKHHSGYEYRQEVLLPGMEDARIFHTLLHTKSPRKMHWKTYTTSSPSGVYYEAVLGFTNPDHFVIGVYDHEVVGPKTLADFNVALNNNRILNFKSHWEKENIKSVWTKVQARAQRNGENLKALSRASVEEIMKEVQYAGRNLVKASPNVRSAISSARKEWTDLIVELDDHQDTKFIVQQFQFAQGYLKKLVTILREVPRVVRRMSLMVYAAAQEHFEQLTEFVQGYGTKIPYKMEDLQQYMDAFVSVMVDFAQDTFALMNRAFTKISNSMPEIIERINWVLDVTSGITECIQDFLGTALEKVSTWYTSIHYYVKDFVDNDLVRTIAKDTLNLGLMIVSDIVEETKEYMEDFKTYLLKNIPEQEFRELVEMIADYVQKKAGGQKTEDVAEIKQIYEQFVKLVKKVGSQVFSFESEEGSFMASIPLPSPISSLSEISRIFDRMSFPSPPVIHYNVPSYRFGITEVLNKLRHGAGINQLVPPYEGFALIVGSQFYRTFDGKIFQFDGSCQYLLASDFEDGNFTVAMDYDRQSSNVARALTIKDSTDAIAIKSDKTIVINKSPMTVADLDNEPQTAGQFTVEHVNDWVVVTGKKGVKVGCSLSYDVCGVKVNGFYHGKVLGLLGKFNQEKFDDLTTSEGEITDNVNQFVESWKLNKQCKEQAVIGVPAITSEATQKCAEAFGRSSNLRPCYGVVEPQDYKRMCETFSSKPGFDVTKAVCTASTGYAKNCRLQYAPVKVPSECRSV